MLKSVSISESKIVSFTKVEISLNYDYCTYMKTHCERLIEKARGVLEVLLDIRVTVVC